MEMHYYTAWIHKYKDTHKLILKGGLVRLSESAFMWSTMVNTSSGMEKCTRKAFMTP